MGEIKRFYIRALRKKCDGVGPNESYEVGIIQGLIYGLCVIPNDTIKWDCEIFPKYVLFAVDCTEEQIQALMHELEKMRSRLHTFHEIGFYV